MTTQLPYGTKIKLKIGGSKGHVILINRKGLYLCAVGRSAVGKWAHWYERQEFEVVQKSVK